MYGFVSFYTFLVKNNATFIYVDRHFFAHFLTRFIYKYFIPSND